MFGADPQIEVIDFQQSHPGRITGSSQNRGIGDTGIVGRYLQQNNCFVFRLGRKTRVDDLLLVGIILPVVIGRDQGTSAVVEVKNRVSQCIGDSARS